MILSSPGQDLGVLLTVWRVEEEEECWWTGRDLQVQGRMMAKATVGGGEGAVLLYKGSCCSHINKYTSILQ